MICAHVLDLIDAGPFVDVPRDERDAASEHARTCPTCGPAFQAAATLAVDLAALPEQATSPDLAAIVMARIAQLPTPEIAPAVAAARSPEMTTPARERGVAALMVGGLASGIGAALAVSLASATLTDMLVPRIGGISASLTAISGDVVGAAGLGLGLALYLAGLFEPVRERGRTSR